MLIIYEIPDFCFPNSPFEGGEGDVDNLVFSNHYFMSILMKKIMLIILYFSPFHFSIFEQNNNSL